MAESNEITLQVVSASTDKFLENTRKRIIKAYLSVIIMTRIDEASITTPTDIISIIKKNYHVQISSGTIYPIFRTLERERLIMKLPKKTKRLYSLTRKGKERLEYLRKCKMILPKVPSK